jgi:hypothetical protein
MKRKMGRKAKRTMLKRRMRKQATRMILTRSMEKRRWKGRRKGKSARR